MRNIQGEVQLIGLQFTTETEIGVIINGQSNISYLSQFSGRMAVLLLVNFTKALRIAIYSPSVCMCVSVEANITRLDHDHDNGPQVKLQMTYRV